jgi:hypothetical protein
MPCDISSSNSADAELHPFQLDLYPLDPWGANQLMAIVEKPSPGLVRALIGPVTLGGCEFARGAIVRCLAVAENRTLASSVFLPRALLYNSPLEFWRRVLDSFAQAREHLLPRVDFGMPRTPPDCLKSWSSPLPWIPRAQCGDPVHGAVRALSHMEVRRQTDLGVEKDSVDYLRIEAEANAAFCKQIAEGVRHVLQALDPALFNILMHRPKLSIAVAHQILCMAKMHSPRAVTYALQAMRTESQGLLHLIASDHPKEDAQQVQDAIFSGQSLPDAFLNLGVAKAAHRQSLLKPVGRGEQWQEPELSMSELQIAGCDWLTVMRLTQHIPLNDEGDWSEFRGAVQLVLEQNFKHEKTALQLLLYCTRPTMNRCSARLGQVISHARALATAVRGLTNVVVAFDDVVSKLLELVGTIAADGPYGPYGSEFPWTVGLVDPWHLAAGAAHITGKPLSEILGSLFEEHPKLPSSFTHSEYLSAHPLNSLELVMGNGVECNSRLQLYGYALRYLTDGVALFGVRSGSEFIGTIAFQYDVSENNPKVQVQEISTSYNVDNAFFRLARSLEDAFNTDEEIPAWVAYQDQCAQWRRRATSSA